jgi:hypothetical protein
MGLRVIGGQHQQHGSAVEPVIGQWIQAETTATLARSARVLVLRVESDSIAGWFICGRGRFHRAPRRYFVPRTAA